MSRSRLVASGVTTGLVASSMASGGVVDVLHLQASVDGFVRLGCLLQFVALGEQDALAKGAYVVLQVSTIRFGFVFRGGPIELE